MPDPTTVTHLVSIKELGEKTKQLLGKVQNGEQVLVTSQGRFVALLTPFSDEDRAAMDKSGIVTGEIDGLPTPPLSDEEAQESQIPSSTDTDPKDDAK